MFDPMMNQQLQHNLRRFREQFEEAQPPTAPLEPAGEAKPTFWLGKLFSKRTQKTHATLERKMGTRTVL